MKPVISRHTSAQHINAILNHPEVLPHVSMDGAPLDMSAAIQHPDIFALYGEFGGQVYQRLQPGLFEAHSAFLPEGRGAWSLAATQQTLRWIFTRTEAMEIVTRCPSVASKALAKSIGGEFLFTRPDGWVKDGKPIPADVYSLSVQGWMKSAPNLVERGRWFHARLDAEFDRLGIVEPPHEETEAHDRYVGAACEMFFAGQPQKAVVLYNRVACIMGWHQIAVTSINPLAVDIGSATLVMRGDDFFVLPPQKQAA